MYQLDGFSKSNPPQNRQLIVLITDSKQLVDDFVGELTFQNHQINALCQIKALSEARPSRWSIYSINLYQVTLYND
jgi:hypothetical protein